MKKFYFVLMLLGCIGGLAACSDDDGDNGNGQGAGNGGSGVIVQEKKVSQIKRIEDDQDTVVYQFDYDAQGRLFKFIYDSPYSNESTTTISYAENQITYTENGNTSTIRLKGGYAQEEETMGDEGYKYITSFTYSGDYIATVVDQEYRKVGNNWEKDNYLFTTEFTVKDGRPEKCLDMEFYRNVKDSMVIAYAYNPGVKNNTNIDLWTLFTDAEIGNLSSILCVAGKRFTHFPSQITAKSMEGKLYETTTINYVVDGAGYITKVTVTSVEEDDEVVEPAPDPQLAASSKSYTDVTIYEITYR